MTTLIVVTREGDEKRLHAKTGVSVMEVIRDAGIGELLAMCGGCCSCATCHIYVDTAFIDRIPAMADDENDILDGSSHRDVKSRLSCQVRLTALLDGLRVTIAPED